MAATAESSGVGRPLELDSGARTHASVWPPTAHDRRVTVARLVLAGHSADFDGRSMPVAQVLLSGAIQALAA